MAGRPLLEPISGDKQGIAGGISGHFLAISVLVDIEVTHYSY
jgi:hypothetical protein